MVDLSKHKLELTYPCSWKYKIVMLESINVKNISKDIFSGREHDVKESNVSKKENLKVILLNLLFIMMMTEMNYIDF